MFLYACYWDENYSTLITQLSAPLFNFYTWMKGTDLELF